MLRPVLTLFAVSALALAGCAQGGDRSKDSSKEFKGVEQQVAKTVENLQRYGERGEGEKVCGQLLTAKLSQQIAKGGGPKGCAGAVSDAMEETDNADLLVTAVKVDPKDPDKATATVKAEASDEASQSSTMELVKESGGWKISSFG